MENLHAIGTILTLKDSGQEIMIIGRFPLTEWNGQEGYFDYLGCLYPTGVYTNGLYYFNDSDIDEIIFEGYVNKREEYLRSELENNQDQLEKYHHFTLEEWNDSLLNSNDPQKLDDTLDLLL